MTPELRDKLNATATLYGMGVSEFIRYAVIIVLDTTVYPKDEDDGK